MYTQKSCFISYHEKEAAVGVVLGKTSKDELLGLLLRLLFVTAEWADAVGSGLSRHKRRQEDGAADGESVEQSRGADGIEAHEDVALLNGGGVDDVAEDVLGEQRRGDAIRLGCLKLLLAQV